MTCKFSDPNGGSCKTGSIQITVVRLGRGWRKWYATHSQPRHKEKLRPSSLCARTSLRGTDGASQELVAATTEKATKTPCRAHEKIPST